MTDSEAARLFPVNPASLMLGEQTWAWNADGGGYQPIDPSLRGDLDMACPSCGKLLVRDGSRALLDRSIVKCPNCKRVFGGADFAPKGGA